MRVGIDISQLRDVLCIQIPMLGQPQPWWRFVVGATKRWTWMCLTPLGSISTALDVYNMASPISTARSSMWDPSQGVSTPKSASIAKLMRCSFSAQQRVETSCEHLDPVSVTCRRWPRQALWGTKEAFRQISEPSRDCARVKNFLLQPRPFPWRRFRADTPQQVFNIVYGDNPVSTNSRVGRSYLLTPQVLSQISQRHRWRAWE